jgi:hypothetical protein
MSKSLMLTLGRPATCSFVFKSARNVNRFSASADAVT